MARWGIRAVAVAASILAASAAAASPLCDRWTAPEKVGTLDTAIINEASGVAVSRQFPGRLYFNNDSGDGPNFYVTDMAGAGTRTVKVAGFTPQDVEDIALGPCGGGRTCLYLGDTGDNAERRATLTFVVLAEKQAYGETETPLRMITARYPDGPHDAESFAVHPNGDLYLITKPRDVANRRALPAKIFRLTAAQLADTSGAPQTFEQVGEIDLPYILYQNGLAGQLATGMDFSADGTRMLVITYQSALEVTFDVSKPIAPSRGWMPSLNYRVIRTEPLPQAEAIAYGLDGRSFIYTTERVEARFIPSAPNPVDIGGAAPLYRQVCEPPAPAAAPAP